MSDNVYDQYIIEDESDVTVTLKDGILLIKIDKQNMSDNSFTVTF